MRALLPLMLSAFLIPIPPQAGSGAAAQNSASNLAGKLSDSTIALQSLKEQLSKDPEFAQNVFKELQKNQNRWVIAGDGFDGGVALPGTAPSIGLPGQICPVLVQSSTSDDDLLKILKTLGGDDAYIKMVTDWEHAHTLSASQRHDYRMQKINELASDLRKKAGQ